MSHRLVRFLVVLLVVCPGGLSSFIEAQTNPPASITLRLEGVSLHEALQQMGRQSGLNLVYADDLVNGVTVSADLEAAGVDQVLRHLLRGSNLSYRRITTDHVVIIRRTQTSIVEGTITDSETGAPIEGVSVFLAHTTVGGQTDQVGRYHIDNVPPGAYELVVRHIGYELIKAPFQIITPGTFQYDRRLTRRILTLSATDVVGTTGEEAIRPGSKKWKGSLERFKAV